MALIIPLPTVTATTLTTLSLLGTAASGGTGPYTYQWYRTFSAVGVYLAVAGATSLTLADTGLAAEQEYSYSLKATDSLAVTGFSGPISAFTAQAALDTNGADAGLAGIVSGGAGGSSGFSGTLTDRSGTITIGGTSQVLAPVNATRKYLNIKNTSSANIAVNFTAAASLTSGSYVIVPLGSLNLSTGSFITTESVTVVGATTGQTFVAKEA